MSDAPLLDAPAAMAAAEAGIQTSDEHALDEWKREADVIISSLALNRYEFTADDVWAQGLGPNPTGSNTALGARMRSAVRNGWIVNTGRTARTAQVASHGQPVTVWRSTLVTPPTKVCPTCDGDGWVTT